MVLLTEPSAPCQSGLVIALLVALGVDNFGSGLFLPLTLVYATRVVGLPIAVAGTAVAVGSLVGLVVPPLAGALVDRVGPRVVVIASQVLQGLGAAVLLAADGAAGVAVAVVAIFAGQQMFYSSLFALISDVVGDRGKDRPFALVAMVRSACFGLGGLAAGGLLSFFGTGGLRVALAVNLGSFLACAALLAVFVRVPHRRRPPERTVRPWGDRRFLALIGTVALAALATDFFVAGTPVFLLDVLDGPAWLPGAVLATHTVLTSAFATLAVRVTQGLRRTTTMALGAAIVVGWCGWCLAAAGLPGGWLPAVMLGGVLLTAAAVVLFGARANALAVAMAPDAARGRYLAAFQYAFTVPGVVTPAVVALFAVGVAVPWLVVGACAAASSVALLALGRRLPDEVLLPTAASSPAR